MLAAMTAVDEGISPETVDEAMLAFWYADGAD